MEIQLRRDDGMIRFVRSIKEAFDAAEDEPEIWKVSWSEGKHRVRFVRAEGVRYGYPDSKPLWIYEPILLPEEQPDSSRPKPDE